MAEKSKGSVLVVDDEEPIRNSLGRLLRHHHYNVATARDGRLALERLRKGEHFDAIILDLLMPGLCGKDFVKAVAEEKLFPLEKIMLLTAVHNADNATAYLQFGCAGYLGKPYSNVSILEQIDRICGDGTNRDLNALI